MKPLKWCVRRNFAELIGAYNVIFMQKLVFEGKIKNDHSQIRILNRLQEIYTEIHKQPSKTTSKTTLETTLEKKGWFSSTTQKETCIITKEI